jgi:hypothetical protein
LKSQLEAKDQEEPRFTAANRMSQIQQVILNFVPRDDGVMRIRQLHLPADVTNASGQRQHQTKFKTNGHDQQPWGFDTARRKKLAIEK